MFSIYIIYSMSGEIAKFINELHFKKFSEPPRSIRRSPNNIHGIESGAIPPLKLVREKNPELLNTKINILFHGFYYNTMGYCETFETGRVLIALYMSFYMSRPTYLNIKDAFYCVSHVDGVHKVDSPPEIDLVVIRSDYDDKYTKKYTRHAKRIVIMPVYSHAQKCDFMFENSFFFKCSYEKSLLYAVRPEKKNIILINGTLIGRKGPHQFIRDVDPEIIKNYTVVMVGSDPDNAYSKIKRLADEKQIDTVYIPYICSNEMHRLVVHCKFQVCYCSKGWTDANPRSLNEGIYAGLPYLISDLVEFPNSFRNPEWVGKLGVVCKHDDPTDLNDKMRTLMKMDNESVYDFCEKECGHDTVCQEITERVFLKWNELR